MTSNINKWGGGRATPKRHKEKASRIHQDSGNYSNSQIPRKNLNMIKNCIINYYEQIPSEK